MTTLHILYHAIWFRRHPLTNTTPLSWRESFVLTKELVGLKLR